MQLFHHNLVDRTVGHDDVDACGQCARVASRSQHSSSAVDVHAFGSSHVDSAAALAYLHIVDGLTLAFRTKLGGVSEKSK